MVSQGLVLLSSILAPVFLLAPVATASGGETLIGVVGKDFVVIGADSSASGDIGWTASNLDKIAVLQEEKLAVASVGDAAVSDRLVGQLAAHCAIRLWEGGMGNDVEYVHLGSKSRTSQQPPITEGLSVENVAHLARTMISQSKPDVNMLIAGMMASDGGWSSASNFARRVQSQVDAAMGKEVQTIRAGEEARSEALHLQPRLFWLDRTGALQNVRYGAHGYASYFCLSILDQNYRSDMNETEAVQLVRDCFEQLRTRYVLNSPKPPCIKIVNKDGCSLVG